MSPDREAACRSAIHHAVDTDMDNARKRVDDCALPRPRDNRRLLALQDAVGDIAAGLSRGHTDMSHEWLVVAGLAQDALEEQVLEAARRPVGPWDFGGDAA